MIATVLHRAPRIVAAFVVTCAAATVVAALVAPTNPAWLVGAAGVVLLWVTEAQRQQIAALVAERDHARRDAAEWRESALRAAAGPVAPVYRFPRSRGGAS